MATILAAVNFGFSLTGGGILVDATDGVEEVDDGIEIDVAGGEVDGACFANTCFGPPFLGCVTAGGIAD